VNDEETAIGVSTAEQVVHTHFNDPEVYHEKFSSGAEHGDCFANTKRLISLLEKEGLDISSFEAVLMWYEPIPDEPHYLVVSTDVLRNTDNTSDIGKMGLNEWREHVFLKEKTQGVNQPKIYDLSSNEDSIGMGMNDYLNKLLRWEITRNNEALQQIQLVTIPANELLQLKTNNRYELGKQYKQQNLSEVLAVSTPA
jgi:hypothetical protein